MPSRETLQPPRSENGGIAVGPASEQPYAPASRVRWWWPALIGLFPLVPAWAVNIVPVIFPIPVNRVLLATFLGLLPLSCVVATLGHQVSSIAAAGEFALSDVLTPQLLLALATLAALALLAPLLRARRARS